MPDVTALFWDVGGVILSNGWDRPDRARRSRSSDWIGKSLKTGTNWPAPHSKPDEITLDTYLQRTVFYRKRDFTREEFTTFIFAQSEEFPESRAVLSERGGNRKISAWHHQQRGARTQ